MKKENAIDRLQGLATELSCVVDNLTIIQCALSDGYVPVKVSTDALFAVRNHIEHISDAMEYILMEVGK